MFCDVYRVAQKPLYKQCSLWYQDAFAPHCILWKGLRRWGNLSLGNWSHFVWQDMCWRFGKNCASVAGMRSKERYALSVKLSDFTVLRHTWRKNWVNCAVLTRNSTGLRTVLSSRLSYRTAQFTQGIPQFPQFTCRHHDGISRHSIHSADEHRMIYSFSNTTPYSTFYTFFSFFGQHYGRYG